MSNPRGRPSPDWGGPSYLISGPEITMQRKDSEAENERAGKARDLLGHTLFSRWVC